MPFVYIVRCADNALYVGLTHTDERRVVRLKTLQDKLEVDAMNGWPMAPPKPAVAPSEEARLPLMGMPIYVYWYTAG